MRYLLFSDKYGIYLGGGNWSMVDDKGILGAPSYPGNDLLVQALVSHPNDGNIKMVECYPDLPGNRCSPNAAANSGLPRWGKDGAPGPLASGKVQTASSAGPRTFDHRKKTDQTPAEVMVNVPATTEDEDPKPKKKAKKSES